MKELKMLNSNTAEVLSLISEQDFIKNFVLVGGSALTILIEHRLSEDLDFFTNIKFDIELILNHLNNKFDNVRIIAKSSNQIDLIVQNVKVTFCYQSNNLLENKELLMNNIYIASLDTIIAMKILTVFLRAKLRDYFDLYVYSLKFGFSSIVDIGNNNVPNFSKKLFQKSIVYIEDILDENIDELNPIIKSSKEDIRDYFVEQIKDYNLNIRNA